jgi:hypothetical protein
LPATRVPDRTAFPTFRAWPGPTPDQEDDTGRPCVPHVALYRVRRPSESAMCAAVHGHVRDSTSQPCRRRSAPRAIGPIHAKTAAGHHPGSEPLSSRARSVPSSPKGHVQHWRSAARRARPEDVVLPSPWFHAPPTAPRQLHRLVRWRRAHSPQPFRPAACRRLRSPNLRQPEWYCSSTPAGHDASRGPTGLMRRVA